MERAGAALGAPETHRRCPIQVSGVLVAKRGDGRLRAAPAENRREPSMAGARQGARSGGCPGRRNPAQRGSCSSSGIPQWRHCWRLGVRNSGEGGGYRKGTGGGISAATKAGKARRERRLSFMRGHGGRIPERRPSACRVNLRSLAPPGWLRTCQGGSDCEDVPACHPQVCASLKTPPPPATLSGLKRNGKHRCGRALLSVRRHWLAFPEV